jgi:hypothetical protein
MPFNIPPELYQKIYIFVLCSLCLLISFKFSFSKSATIVNSTQTRVNYLTNQLFGLILTLIIIVFIGTRPHSGAFVDMNYYAYVYNNIYDGVTSNYAQSGRGEWFFYEFGNFCKRLGFSDTQYFTSIAIVYFGLMFLACWMLMRRNLFVALLFCFISFSCFSYGVNGMRNGMACSIAMVAICMLCGNKWEKFVAVILMLIAYETHHSTALPCICAISALLFVKETKWAIYFWIASIFISLIAGDYVTELFVNLGFDERMEQYANLEEEGTVIPTDQFSGFRIDFIIYSIMPIIMAWYITIKRNFKDKMYHIIATSYILANAFWIMVIRSEQSNRFAYLSWFLYPIVIAYPLLRMNVWEDQDRKTALFLVAYSGFTFFMNFVYYG